MLGTVDCVKPEIVRATTIRAGPPSESAVGSTEHEEEATARVPVPAGLHVLPHEPAESAEELSSEGESAAMESLVGRIGEVDDEFKLDPTEIAALAADMYSGIAGQTDDEEKGQADQTDVESKEESAGQTDHGGEQIIDSLLQALDVDSPRSVISTQKRKFADDNDLHLELPKQPKPDADYNALLDGLAGWPTVAPDGQQLPTVALGEYDPS
jgi:hypothetical protein